MISNRNWIILALPYSLTTVPYTTLTKTYIKTIEEKIQTGLNNINKWCNRNGFKISVAKTTGVLFTKTKKPQKIAITLNNQSIKIESEAKFLGVIFDSRLTWRPHVEYIITKCKKRINLMRAVSGYK